MRAGWTKGIVLGALASSVSVAGCVRRGVEVGSPEVRPVRVIARSTGGIGALEVVRIVELDSAATRWVAFTRRLCDGNGSSAGCPAATDSAAGRLNGDDATRVWSAVREARFAELRQDYGSGPGADRMSLEVRVIGSDGREHSVHGDESTVPPALSRVLETMNAVISAARGSR